MANYNSVQLMLANGVANMTQIVDTVIYNKLHILKAPSFLDVEDIFVHSSSWIGIGVPEDHICVNRNSYARLHALYTEEGIAEGMRFFKIRWSGYSSQTVSTDYNLEYDVIFWGDNDLISLNIIKVPRYVNSAESSGGGFYSLLRGQFYVHGGLRKISKRRNADYTLMGEDPSFINPKCLVKYNNQYYTLTKDSENNDIPMLLEGELTAAMFINNGINPFLLEPFQSLGNFEVVTWCESDEFNSNSLSVFGKPKNSQVLLYDPIDVASRGGFVDVKLIDSDNVLLQVSSDGGDSWKYYTSEWTITDSDSVGMNIETFNSLTSESWNEFSQSSNCIFKIILLNETSYVGNLCIKYKT